MKKQLLILTILVFINSFAFAGTQQIIISRSLGSFPDTNTFYNPIMGAPDAGISSLIQTFESIFPTDGNITLDYVELTVAPNDCGGCPVNVRRRNYLYLNGVLSSSGCDIIGANKICGSTTKLSINEGDRVVFGSAPDVGVTSATEIFISLTWEPDIDNETVLLGGYGETKLAPSLQYIAPHGRNDTNESTASHASTLILGDFEIEKLIAYRTTTAGTGTSIDLNIEIDGTVFDGCRIEGSNQECTKTFSPLIGVTDWNEVVVKETGNPTNQGQIFVGIQLNAQDDNNFIIATTTDTTLPTCSTLGGCVTSNYYTYASAGDNSGWLADLTGRVEMEAIFWSSIFTLDKFAVSLDAPPNLGNDWNFMARTQTANNIICDIANTNTECVNNNDFAFDNNSIFLQLKFTKGAFTFTPFVNGLRSTMLFKPTPLVNVCEGLCTYSGSGDFILPCGCNCDLNETIDIGGNLFWIDDSQEGGTTIISEDINNVGNFTITGTDFCTVKGIQHIIGVN